MSDPRAMLPVAAWYPDPTDATALRWWDGRGWTPHVTSRSQQPPSDPRFTDPRYQSPPVVDDSRALPTLAAAAQASAGPPPLPSAVPTAAPSYEPAYAPAGGYQAAYLSAHPEADLSPRPGAYQQPAPQQGQPYPGALPSDIPTQYQQAPQSPAATGRPDHEPIDYPSVMDGYPQPGQAAGPNDPGPMAASLHANRTAPAPAGPIPGRLDSYPPPGGPAEQQGASLLSHAPPPSIAALLGNQSPQQALPAAPSGDLTRQAAAQLAAAEQLAQQSGSADKAAAYKAAAAKAVADKAAFEAAAAQAAAARDVAAGPVGPPEPGDSGGFTEGYQAGFRAALEGKAQIAAADKRSREVDPNAAPVPLAGLDPANQPRPLSRALDPNNDPLAAPMHRGGV